jgi:uncharacterized protein (DUF1800 family)
MELTTQAPAPVLAGITPYMGTFGKEQLLQLLKRSLMGVTKADIDFFTGKTLNQVVDLLLTQASDPTTQPLKTYALTGDNITQGETWVYASDEGNVNNARRGTLRNWLMGQFINADRTLQAKMLFFWSNHFATEIEGASLTRAYEYWLMLHRNTMGNFKDMVRNVTFSANMLDYLNGDRNTKSAPDENYGRELMELFTLGKSPNSKYTEDDVKAAAKLLTGWRCRRVLNTTTNKYAWETYFVPNDHDAGAKQFSSFFNNKIITGNTAQNTEANAKKEIDDLLDMIFAQREAAMFICRKLYRYFVYYKIDATIEASMISPMADLLIQNNWNIKPVLKALLTSDFFFTMPAKACIIKSPLEFVVGFFREFKLVIPPITATNYRDVYSAWSYFVGVNGAEGQGQILGDPPNVAGWSAYYQEPAFNRNWINTDSLPKRLRFVDNFMSNSGAGIGNSLNAKADVLAFTDQFGTDAADPNKLIDAVLQLLYRVPVSTTFRTYLKTTILLGGQASDYYWTDAWNAYKTTPNATNTNIVLTRLLKFYRFIVDNPEYQLS